MNLDNSWYNIIHNFHVTSKTCYQYFHKSLVEKIFKTWVKMEEDMLLTERNGKYDFSFKHDTFLQ